MNFFITILLCISIIIGNAQSISKPKLVVGVVVDQMRYDFLVRYKSNYGQNGFNRLLNQSFVATNMHYNYAPTYTGPGHTSIYSGTTPAIHGIAGNNWIQDGNKNMYCSQDDSVKTVGASGKAGEMSPKNLKTTTICDQIKLFSNQRSKVIGVALKDRGAILPAGHTANAAYWYDSKSGNWISSTFYMDKLPNWLMNFNSQNWSKKILAKGWNTLLPIDKYINSTADDNHWEDKICKGGACCGEPKTVNGESSSHCNSFPYSFSEEDMNDVVKVTPFGNTLTTMMAKEIIKNENLGKGAETDVLAVSYSSTDYVGHSFGPYSKESEDTYVRLDREMEDLLNFLDSQIGKDNYILFLSADHGVQDVPGFSQSLKIPAGTIDDKKQKGSFNQLLKEKLGIDSLIKNIINEQIMLNYDLMSKNKLTADQICDVLNAQDSKTLKGIHGFYSFKSLSTAPIPNNIKEKLINGYCPRRSGDISILLEPNYMSFSNKGTTHGSPYSHDTHIPFLLFGSKIKPKQSNQLYNITDIAPTLSSLLGILQPNGCIGKPIVDVEFLK